MLTDTKTKLVGAFSPTHLYSNSVLEIRNHYGPYIAQDKLMCFAVMTPDGFSIHEYLLTFNLLSFERVVLKRGDIILNKRNRCLYSINGLNALLRDRNLEKGATIDWNEFQGTLISEQGIFPNVQKIKYVSHA